MYKVKGLKGIVLPNLEDDLFDFGRSNIMLDMIKPKTRITHHIAQHLLGSELQLDSELIHSDVTFDPEETVTRGIITYNHGLHYPRLSNIEVEGRILKGTMIPGITGRMAIANFEMRPNIGFRPGSGATPVGTLELI